MYLVDQQANKEFGTFSGDSVHVTNGKQITIRGNIYQIMIFTKKYKM